MYVKLPHLPLFNFAYLFFLFFLSFPLNIFVSFVIIALFPTWLAPCFNFVFQFVLKLVLFLTGKYNFWFSLFTRSIYCTLFLLDCFHFAHGYICICVFSHIFYHCYKPLPLCWAFATLWSYPFFSFFLSSSIFSFSLFYNFNFLSLLYFLYIYSFVCLSYCSFPLAVNL